MKNGLSRERREISTMSQLKYYGVMTILALLISAIGFIQHQRMEAMKRHTAQLKEQNEQLSTANASITAQYKLISEALNNAAEQKERAERQSETLRKQLKVAQAGNDCANTAVPDDVIRMQREAIAETNRLFATPGSTTAALSAP